jgi:hypothetical protein
VLIGSAMMFCNHEPPSSSMRLDSPFCLVTKIQAQADSHNLLVEASSEQEQAQRGADLVRRADGGRGKAWLKDEQGRVTSRAQVVGLTRNRGHFRGDLHSFRKSIRLLPTAARRPAWYPGDARLRKLARTRGQFRLSITSIRDRPSQRESERLLAAVDHEGQHAAVLHPDGAPEGGCCRI